MSARSKGSRNELEVQKILESEGWTCHRAYPSMIKTGKRFFVRSNDIFQCFDICAKKKNEHTRWLQVAVGYKKAQKEDKILQYDFFNEKDKVEIWLKTKVGKWEVFELDKKRKGFDKIYIIERGQKMVLEVK